MFRTYNSNFWMISFSMLLFMTSFNLIIPELNEFITNLGGEDQKGLIITIFTISAAISRPFSGKLSDLAGRKKVMIIGIAISFIVSLLYPLSLSVHFFLLLRFIHGFSAGFLPTGATAMVTDLLPAHKRGRGMGIWGTFISLGIGIGQSFGSIITHHFGLNGLFMTSAAIGAVAGILIIRTNETLPVSTSLRLSYLKINFKDIIEPSVLPAAIVMVLTAPSSGLIFVLTPDMSGYLGIDNKGWFFAFYVISTIFIRLFTSQLSDKIGRRKTLIIGTSFLLFSMILMALANSVMSYTFAAIIFGIATGVSSPTLMAWTADLSPDHRRGVGAGTMFIALEIGIMIGSFSTLWLYNSTPQSLVNAFSFGIILAICSILFLIWHLTFKTSNT
jgi:MFS family permease